MREFYEGPLKTSLALKKEPHLMTLSPTGREQGSKQPQGLLAAFLP